MASMPSVTSSGTNSDRYAVICSDKENEFFHDGLLRLVQPVTQDECDFVRPGASLALFIFRVA